MGKDLPESPKQDPADLLRASARRPKKVLCKICGTEWEQKVDDLYEEAMRIRKEPSGLKYSHADLLGFLRECGYPAGKTTTLSHLSDHKPELWGRFRSE